LLNDHLQGLAIMGQERRVRQDLPPIAGVKVKLHGMTVSEAYAEPGHQKLEINVVNNGNDTIIALPTLTDHTMVVFPMRTNP
jgi:hypothetical protein